MEKVTVVAQEEIPEGAKVFLDLRTPFKKAFLRKVKKEFEVEAKALTRIPAGAHADYDEKAGTITRSKVRITIELFYDIIELLRKESRMVDDGKFQGRYQVYANHLLDERLTPEKPKGVKVIHTMADDKAGK